VRRNEVYTSEERRRGMRSHECGVMQYGMKDVERHAWRGTLRRRRSAKIPRHGMNRPVEMRNSMEEKNTRGTPLPRARKYAQQRTPRAFHGESAAAEVRVVPFSIYVAYHACLCLSVRYVASVPVGCVLPVRRYP